MANSVERRWERRWEGEVGTLGWGRNWISARCWAGGLDRGPNDLAEIDRRERNQSQNQLLSQNQSQSHRQWLVVWYVLGGGPGGGRRGVERP